MKNIKIVKTEEDLLVFSDGSEICVQPHATWCEYIYADFPQIDDLAKEWEFEHPIIFERCDYGFRFGNKNKMVFVPCYAEQDQYYSSDVDIYYNGDLVLKSVDCEGR